MSLPACPSRLFALLLALAACMAPPESNPADVASTPVVPTSQPEPTHSVVANTCAAGRVDCSGEDTCVNLQTDPTHCGSCSNECIPGDACVRGVCLSPPSGMVLVPAGHFNLSLIHI